MTEFSGSDIGTVARDVRWFGDRYNDFEASRPRSAMDDGEVSEWLVKLTWRRAIHSRKGQEILLEEIRGLTQDFRRRATDYLQEKEESIRRLSERVRRPSVVGGGDALVSMQSHKVTANRPLMLGGGEAIVLRLLLSLHEDEDKK